MARLIVRQVPGSEPAAFLLVGQDGTTTPAVAVVNCPRGYPVPGAGNRDLLEELGWYLEQFLEYPFPPATERADAVQGALKSWGREAFEALFGSAPAVRLLDAATRDGYGTLDLDISSDDPRVLGWPWEALYSPEKGWLVHHCAFGRRLNTTLPPPALPESLPRDRLNILLVTARPYENDVAYRSIARPLVELVDRGGFPASVHVLRPPTLEALRQHLREHPGQYHVLHFDGHGAYGRAAEVPGGADSHRFLAAAQGRVIFESEEGKPHAIPAETLSQLLAEHRIPAVVMNACQSGQVDEHAEDAFASVAASLLRAGVGGVVAMAYSLFVSGAEQFLPAFYGRLFETGDLAEAVRAGRQQMLAEERRTSPRGRFPLQDWLVPVLYEHLPVRFELEPPLKGAVEAEAPAVPVEAREQESPYGFVGRDRALLELERAMRLPRAGILIHGLGGIGKTTLVRGFLDWLARTGGIGRGAFWFQFDKISSGEYVLNRLGEPLLGTAFATLSTPEKLEKLGRELSAKPFVVVWDNFEVVQGIEAAGVKPQLPPEDWVTLKELLKRLRGGRTKVLITSRSEEEWLGEVRRKVALGGLVGEERWAFVEGVLHELGIEADRQDPALVELVNLLEGHPLGMRILLPKLEERAAAELVVALNENVAALETEKEGMEGRLWATLRFVEEAVPERLRGLLYPLGLHQRYADASYLAAMAQVAGFPWGDREVTELLKMLVSAGLAQDRGRVVELHPVLIGFLRSRSQPAAQAPDAERWRRSFVMVFAHLSSQLIRMQLHEKEGFLSMHEANVIGAQQLATEAKMVQPGVALTQFRAGYALGTGRREEAARLYRVMAQLAEQRGDEGRSLAAAYDQLGRLAAEQGRWEEAEGCYEKSLAIKERLQDEYGVALTYHHLGNVAAMRQHWEEAEGWYEKSLAIKERIRDEHGVAATYHQLGQLAAGRRALEDAEGWYEKSLAIKERIGDEHGAANTCHLLGDVAAERRAWHEAVGWYHKSLATRKRIRDERGVATDYHKLGNVAVNRGAWGEAEGWYEKSLAIWERLGNEHEAAAAVYHELGNVAAHRRALDQAEAWYRKSLAITERLQDTNVANTYHQLGSLAGGRQRWEEAVVWYQKALAIRERLGEDRGAARAYDELGNVGAARQMWEEAEGWYRKSLAIDERLGDEHRAATTYHNLGVVVAERRAWEEAEGWYRKSLAIFERLGDEQRVAITCYSLGSVAAERRAWEEAEGWYQKSLAIRERLGDKHWAAQTSGKIAFLARGQNRLMDAARGFLQAAQWFVAAGDPHMSRVAAEEFRRTAAGAAPDEGQEMERLWTAAGLPAIEAGPTE
jgi:tetratricopeptide (TPR) repeat protein